jgi:hypothetical protein
VKRSRSIRLVLIGTLSAGAVTGCGPEVSKTPVNSNNVYTNNYYVPGVGYYHAPYRAWYSFPYNDYSAQYGGYFHGGHWTPTPHQSITNISAPTSESAQQAEARRTDISRGGFGHTSRHHFISS